jgi:hypothetical protein
MRAAPATPRAVETGARHRNPRGLRGVSHVSRVAAGDSSAGTAAASRVAMSHDARVATPPRVFVMSDIHTDFPENMSWCASLSDVAFARDAVILGGDVSDDLRVLETTLRLFKRKFRHVFFTPGNHDLWIKGKGKENSEEQRGDETTTIRDSLAKLEAVLSLCETVRRAHQAVFASAERRGRRRGRRRRHRHRQHRRDRNRNRNRNRRRLDRPRARVAPRVVRLRARHSALGQSRASPGASDERFPAVCMAVAAGPG